MADHEATDDPGTPHTKHQLLTDKAHPAVRALEEEHHRAFYLPEHDMHAVVSIEERVQDCAENYVCLYAECWEVNSAGEKTGLYASTGTHSIPHHQLGNDVVDMQGVVEHMTAVMVERLAKRKKALSVADLHPAIKSAPHEQKLRKPALPRGIDDPHGI